MALFDWKTRPAAQPASHAASASTAPIRLNMGCGFDKRAGYVNVDKFDTCQPDVVFDLETFPWPFESNSAQEMLFNHSLEHLGQTSDIFLGIMKEIYRVCRHGATVQVNVPHPRHDFFLNDPTHVRPVTPELMLMFSKRVNREWKAAHSSDTPLALYLDVDFELRGVGTAVEPRYLQEVEAGRLTQDALFEIARERNNVIREYQIKLEVIKP